MHPLTSRRWQSPPAVLAAPTSLRYLTAALLWVALFPLTLLAAALAPLWLERDEEGWKCR